MRFAIQVAVFAVLSMPGAALSQQQRARTEYGIGIDYRRQIGTLADSVDRRTGLAIRIQADVPWNSHFGWRIEGGYAQVQYKRNDPLGMTPINETNLELGGFMRAFPSADAKWRPYVIGGPIASLRASCDVDIAFGQSDVTTCGTGEDFLFGWGAGAGIRLANWVGGWSWFIEGKYLSKVTAANGGRLIAFSIGAAFQ
jgi:hypothetical protein